MSEGKEDMSKLVLGAGENCTGQDQNRKFLLGGIENSRLKL